MGSRGMLKGLKGVEGGSLGVLGVLWIPWGHQIGLMSFDDKSYVPVYK